MRMGFVMRSIQHPLGFCFCPYKVGSHGAANFLQGCVAAVFK